MHPLPPMNFQPAVSPRRAPHSPRRFLALGVWVLLSAPACQPDLGPPPEETLGSTEDALRVANSLTTQALVLNAIATNPQASDLLVSDGLEPLFHPVTGNAYLQRQLKDPDARQFMSYLVSCALPRGTEVEWKNPQTGLLEKWAGLVGLCPTWKTGAPSDTCENWVSACLLARNNALGQRVELSLRGEDPTRPALFSTQAQLRPVEYDPALGGPAPSYTACATPTSGVNRDCGWKADAVGACVPGQTVRLGAGGRAPDQCAAGSELGTWSDARMMVRVCEGLVGCDGGSARMLGQSEGTCSTTQAAVSFTCPASGDFNVLTAPYQSPQTGTASVAVETGTPAGARYRLSEREVFRLREGAYYGNLFVSRLIKAKAVYVDDSGRVQNKEQRVQGAIYGGMFSCQAPEWSTEAAYATHRLCAVPGGGANCAATSTGTCVEPTHRAYPHSRCKKEDGPLVVGDGDYEECSDPSGVYWKQPITVYLHDACALVPGASTDTCAWKGISR